MSVVSDAIGRYGTVAVGVGLGTLGKYGLLIIDGRNPTWRIIDAHLLLLGILGSIAVNVSDWAGLTGDARVLAGAMVAVSPTALFGSSANISRIASWR